MVLTYKDGNLIKSLNMFSDDFMDEEREQAEQEKREDL